jgi:hypothetical protein
MGGEAHGLVQLFQRWRAPARPASVDEITDLRDVAAAEKELAMCRRPSRPARPVSRNRPRYASAVCVDHEPDIRFIDAHAEGHGRHDHLTSSG